MWRVLGPPRFSPAHRTIIKCKVPKLERRRRNLEPSAAIDTIQHDTYRLSVLGLWWYWVTAGRAIRVSRFRKIRACVGVSVLIAINHAIPRVEVPMPTLGSFFGYL